jgi:undecaprenyl phosphate N,N'-diacetylbacillosamine 1-phosphate transferase
MPTGGKVMIKNIFDFVLSFISILLLLPFMAMIAVLIRIKLGRKIFFSQQRPGLNEKIFTIYKFRTMSDAKDENGNLLSDEIRLTKFGKFLRSTSLDELPQLFNVLKGDMSFVGPRALLVEYLPFYSQEQKKRHLVKPGITGWAQVNGRNAISWKKKFEYDLLYICNQSFWLDMKILYLTFVKVIRKSGVSADDHVTMSRFTGSE